MRILVLDCIRRQWDDPRVRTLFERLVTLKLSGYGTTYPECVIPFDKSDFYATHVMIGQDGPQGFEPMTAMKVVSLRRAEEFNDEFTWLKVLGLADDISRHRAHSLCAGIRQRGGDALYCGSWTSDPRLRVDRVTAIAMKEMAYAYMMHEQRQRGDSTWFCFGTPASKTDVFFESMGMREMSAPFLQQPGQLARAFMATDYTPEAEAIAARHEGSYAEREVIRREVESAAPTKEAA